MDGRGGCCIARYSGSTGAGSGGAVYDIATVNRIMLRFRPIAPKPSAGGDTVSPAANTEIYSKPGRGKRRRRSHNKNNNINSDIISSSGEISKRCNSKRRVPNDVSTLPLLPETPVFDVSHNSNKQIMSFDGVHANPGAVATPPQALVGCCVTVECVTETWLEENNGLGRTEEERRANLAKDRCPSFVTEGFERVWWTNAAFKEMVGGRKAAETGVLLVMKDRPVLIYPAFTCRVRVQIYGKEKSSSSTLTLPCDVWRMKGNGWAWRLDLTAALRLGPPWLQLG